MQIMCSFSLVLVGCCTPRLPLHILSQDGFQRWSPAKCSNLDAHHCVHEVEKGPLMAANTCELVLCMHAQGGPPVDAPPGEPHEQPRAGGGGGLCGRASLRELAGHLQHARGAAALCPGPRAVLRTLVTATVCSRPRAPFTPRPRMCASSLQTLSLSRPRSLAFSLQCI